MKKTLIALAVLAASGASFAQVTITGNLTMGYQANTNGGNSTLVPAAGSYDAAGFGVDTSEIDFVATEDLGGGWKAIAKMALAGADRSGESGTGTVNGRNASLSLVTTGGVVSLASTRAADYLSGGIAGVGAYYSGWDSKVFSTRTNRDVVSYMLPLGAFTLSTSYQESANLQGLGQGTVGPVAQTGQSLVTLGGDYNQGPVSANFTYLSFNSKEQAGNTRDQTRLSGSYDFGVAKVGLGAVMTNQTATAATGVPPAAVNGKITDLLIGASVPFGALTLGAEFVSRKFDDYTVLAIGSVDANGANIAGLGGSGTITGTSLQATYDLSKRTSVIGNYARWTQRVNQDASSQFQLLLSHSF